MRIQYFMDRLSDIDFENRSDEEIEEARELGHDLKMAGLVWIWQKEGISRYGGAKRYAERIMGICKNPGWSVTQLDDSLIRCLRVEETEGRTIVLASIMPPGMQPFFISKNFLFYFLAVVCFALFVSWFTAKWVFRPLEDMRALTMDFMEYMKSGEYLNGRKPRFAKTVKSHRLFIFRDEFSVLMTEFLRFIDHVSDVLVESSLRSSQLAHEMITPLAVLQVQLTDLMAKKSEVTKEELKQLSHRIEHLNQFVRKYFNYAEAKANVLQTSSLFAIDLDEVVTNLCEDLNQVHHSRIRLSGDGSKVRILVDPADLEHFLQNLIVNALRYSEHEVNVSVLGSVLRISDLGPGLPTSVEKALGTPFNRGHHFVEDQTPSHGLGLSICHAIAKRYDWDLNFKSSEKGLLVSIDFRCASDERTQSVECMRSDKSFPTLIS